MIFDDHATSLQAALMAVYRLVEQGYAPNGIAPDDCGQYREVIGDLHDEYASSIESAQLLFDAGHSTTDPHQTAIKNVRGLWATHVRLSLPHELPLIEALRRAVHESLTRPRMGLLEIIDALQAASDADTRRKLALDMIEDASALQPADMVRLADTLKSTFQISATWIKEWRKAVQSVAKSRREAAVSLVAAPEPQEASDELKRTWPYLIDKGALVFCAQRADMFGGSSVIRMPIADFHAKITEEQIGEDGKKMFLLEGETIFGRPFTLTIDAEDFADDRRLKATLTAAAGAQSPIAVGMAKHLAASIQKVSGEIPSIKRYTRTGWSDGVFLLPGRSIDGTTIVLGRKLPYSVNEEARLDLGLQAFEALLQSHTPERGGPALSFLFTPPLALPAGWRNERYGLFIAGRTGSLKSSWSQAAMCMYGPGFIRDDLLVKWGQGATNNALMAMAVAAYDLPFLIDNYKPNTGDGPKAFINLIHNIVEGGEKDRLNRSSELRDSRPVFAWPFVTGEDVPDHDPASLARVLVLPFARPDGDPVHLTTAQNLAVHLCAVGRSWISWIESDDGNKVITTIAEKFGETRRKWAGYLLKERPDMVNVFRVASNLTTNELTWAIIEQHPAMGPIAQRYSNAYFDGLCELGRCMASYTAESLEATRYISMLRDLLVTKQALLISRGETPNAMDGDRMIGWKDEKGGAYLLSKPVRSIMERHFGKDCLGSLSEKTLYSQLQDLGHLLPAKDKATHVIWEMHAAQRVIRLSSESLLGEKEVLPH